MDSYRVEKRAVQEIMLHDEDAEIEPVPSSGGGHVPERELDRLSNNLQAFNDLFGNISWNDHDRVGARSPIAERDALQREARDRIDEHAEAFGHSADAPATSEVGKQAAVGERELDRELRQERRHVPPLVFEADRREQVVPDSRGAEVPASRQHGSRPDNRDVGERGLQRDVVAAGRKIRQLEVQTEVQVRRIPPPTPVPMNVPSPKPPPTSA